VKKARLTRKTWLLLHDVTRTTTDPADRIREAAGHTIGTRHTHLQGTQGGDVATTMTKSLLARAERSAIHTTTTTLAHLADEEIGLRQTLNMAQTLSQPAEAVNAGLADVMTTPTKRKRTIIGLGGDAAQKTVDVHPAVVMNSITTQMAADVGTFHTMTATVTGAGETTAPDEGTTTTTNTTTTTETAGIRIDVVAKSPTSL
jgi:hypothetical protein